MFTDSPTQASQRHLEEMGDACLKVKLIDEDGVFNVPQFESFVNEVNLNPHGLSYVVVSIIGAQSSGKSTLLNHLFGTNFEQMDSMGERKQTTQGIWLGRAQNFEKCTLVMDFEGTDGGERGDDTTFEKQSALFALVVSDILLINMWCNDIGRHQAANKPLLTTIFQVMMKLFSPRKITMLFVIRDKTKKTSLENLESTLRRDIQKIWDVVPKPQDHQDNPFSYYFNVEVVALSSYDEKEELFKEQVLSLRDRFQYSIIPGALAGDRRIVPASGFAFSTQQFWKDIKENRDLDLPAHNVMVARVRCMEISDHKFFSFTSAEEWKRFVGYVENDYIPGIGKKISSLLDTCLSEYDTEATYFVESESAPKRQDLESKIVQLITPPYKYRMDHLRTTTLQAFKQSFDSAIKTKRFAVAASDCIDFFLKEFDRGSEDDTIQQVLWHPADLKVKLERDINAYVMSVRATKLSRLSDIHKSNLATALAETVKPYLHSPGDITWRDIREHLVGKTTAVVRGFESDLSEFELSEASKIEQVSDLKNHGNHVVESCAKEEAATVSIRMINRFSTLFHFDGQSQRKWKSEEQIMNITRTAYSECLKMLLIVAEIWLDEDGDNIQRNISRTEVNIFDPLASSQQMRARTKKIPGKKIIIPHMKCQFLWTKFMVEIFHTVGQALAILNKRREARKRNMKMLMMSGVLAIKITLAASGLGPFAFVFG